MIKRHIQVRKMMSLLSEFCIDWSPSLKIASISWFFNRTKAHSAQPLPPPPAKTNPRLYYYDWAQSGNITFCFIFNLATYFSLFHWTPLRDPELQNHKASRETIREPHFGTLRTQKPLSFFKKQSSSSFFKRIKINNACKRKSNFQKKFGLENKYLSAWGSLGSKENKKKKKKITSIAVFSTRVS